MENDYEYDLQSGEDMTAQRGFMNIKLKTDIILIWIIIFINLVFSWLTYFILLGLNVDNLNLNQTKNGGVMFAKTIMLIQGLLCLLAGVFLISMSKVMKFSVLPLAIYFIAVAILSFILTARLGAINKAASKGTLTEDTVAKARSFALVVASIYTGAVVLLIAYVWIFKPDVYNFIHHKLTATLTAPREEEVDTDWMEAITDAPRTSSQAYSAPPLYSSPSGYSRPSVSAPPVYTSLERETAELKRLSDLAQREAEASNKRLKEFTSLQTKYDRERREAEATASVLSQQQRNLKETQDRLQFTGRGAAPSQQRQSSGSRKSSGSRQSPGSWQSLASRSSGSGSYNPTLTFEREPSLPTSEQFMTHAEELGSLAAGAVGDISSQISSRARPAMSAAYEGTQQAARQAAGAIRQTYASGPGVTSQASTPAAIASAIESGNQNELTGLMNLLRE